MVFGTFDILHKGHEYLLSTAKSFGDELYITLARDKTVLEIKGKLPQFTEKIRRQNLLKKFPFIKGVLLGKIKDKYKTLEKIKPAVICLGYDQTFFTGNLEKVLKKRKIKAKIIRLKPYKPKLYKSSRFRDR